MLNLKGPLPDSLPEALPALEELVFSGTGFTGDIPTDWFQEGAWQALETLQLHNNYHLTGEKEDSARVFWESCGPDMLSSEVKGASMFSILCPVCWQACWA